MKEITIRTNNSAEGLKKIEKLWKKVLRGNMSLFLTGEMIPMARYSNYYFDKDVSFDLSILVVDYDFMQKLEQGCLRGKFKKYDLGFDNSFNISKAIQSAWQQVMEDSEDGLIERSYTDDYGCTIPANYSRDHRLHCLLYIALKKKY